MKHALLMLAPAVLLAGCNKGVELKNASVEDVAKATKDAHFITPGKWSTTSEILAINMDGMPGEAKAMADAMSKTMVGRKTVFDSCVTEEEAKKPAAKMFAGGDKGNCVYDKFSMSGGRLSAVMSCKRPDGQGAMTMTMDGDYGDQSYAVNVEMKMAGGPGPMGGGMTMKARNSGKRVGECAKG